MLRLIVIAAMACCANASANALWKAQFDRQAIDVTSVARLCASVWAWRIILGVGLYAFSMLVFFYLLSHYRLADVAPMLAMTYLFNLVAAYFFFGDAISVGQMIGISMVMAGIVIYARSTP